MPSVIIQGLSLYQVGMIFVSYRGWNALILKLIYNVSDHCQSAIKEIIPDKIKETSASGGIQFVMAYYGTVRKAIRFEILH